jgi:hypothetical protein
MTLKERCVVTTKGVCSLLWTISLAAGEGNRESRLLAVQASAPFQQHAVTPEHVPNGFTPATH